ncbi:MAG TPA: hypothetical protein VJB37_02035 [Patescibacteria group bacterium]|nr:hypothetical protein [Patescibacteria group bacterium]
MPNTVYDKLRDKETIERTIQPERPAETLSISPEQPTESRETGPTISEKENFLEESIEALKNKLRASKKRTIVLPSIKDETTLKIEDIMSEDLIDVYRELDRVQQQEFKLRGEETAWEINQMLGQARIKTKKIFQLLLNWLKMLPGINRFFLEQEAKIKTDKILALKKRV